MKTPAHPVTIHVIEAKYVVTYLAAPRPSIWIRAQPYVAQGLSRARRGLVQSGRVVRCVVMTLFHMITWVGLGAMSGIRLVNTVSIRWLAFVFIILPLFVMSLFFLLGTLVFAWSMVDAIYRDVSHLPRP